MVDSNSYPKVSVLISVFNQLHCLRKSLESVLMQDYPNIEIIIGDDVSTDGNVEDFLTAFDSEKTKYHCNPKNLGANGNYRKMLEEYASGEYAVVLNADDYWTDKQFISKSINVFLANKDVALVFGEVKVYIEETDTFLMDKSNQNLPKIIDGNQFFIDYPNGYSLPHLACIYNRPKAIALDFYQSDIISADWESLLKLVQGSKIGRLSQRVGVLTRHRENYTKNTDINTLFRTDEYIQNLYNFARQKGNFEKAELDYWRLRMLKRHHIKWLIKLWFLDKSKIPVYQEHLANKYPNFYKSLRFDVHYNAYLLIRKIPFLLRWAFKNVLRQESFIADLLAHQSQKS